MEKLVITGKTPLKGEVEISGAKNAAVAIIPATLLINGICTIENLPNISDVKLYCEILQELGAIITWNNEHEVVIDTRNIKSFKAPLETTRKFRASYYLIGALLGRLKKAEVGLPGGCNLGPRPMDQHVKGFEALGANVETTQGKITATAKKLKGASVYMDVASVGATINTMLASVLAEGTTIIDNAAKEPHIVDVANFLNTMGADIRGAGTDVIKINGVSELKGGATYSVVPDQIEAGTFMLAAVATKGDITIKNCITAHLASITAKLEEMVNLALCEAQIESLVIAKGYTDCVAFINDGTIKIVVSAPENGLTKQDAAKIKEIAKKVNLSEDDFDKIKYKNAKKLLNI